ncbi:dolichol kinase-like isoform X2 [Oscarella lobularis]|uniref:dolichol kinase-like isoform X2 n=1 Tax=Oscarella lobularis TaxID=121494 RepID=UPI003313B971
MLKTFLQELKKQKLHTAETRLVALSCVLVGFFLPDKKLAFFFLAAVPIPSVVLSAWLNFCSVGFNALRPSLHQGIPLGTMLPSLLCSSAVVFTSRHAAYQDISKCLAFYLRPLVLIHLSNLFYTFCSKIPPPKSYVFFAGSTLVGAFLAERVFFDSPPWILRWVYAINIAYFLWTALLYNTLTRCFTAGELILLSTGLALLSFDTILFTLVKTRVISPPAFFSLSRDDSFIVFQVTVMWLIITILTSTPLLLSIRGNETERRRNSLTLCAYLGFSSIILLLWLSVLLRDGITHWLFTDMPLKIFNNFWLLTFWALLVALSVAVVFWWQQRRNQFNVRTTVARKLFHFLSALVFASGIVCDFHLLRIASTVALAVLTLAEVVRVFNVWPFGASLHAYLSPFFDKQDQGVVVLTPIYLLLGLGLPVWLYPGSKYLKVASLLAQYAGVLSVGIGDAFASLIGSRYGRIKWPETMKTVEESRIGVTHGLQVLQIVGAIIIGSALETATFQIDNIVVPLVTFSLLIAV